MAVRTPLERRLRRAVAGLAMLCAVPVLVIAAVLIYWRPPAGTLARLRRALADAGREDEHIEASGRRSSSSSSPSPPARPRIPDSSFRAWSRASQRRTSPPSSTTAAYPSASKQANRGHTTPT
jgi:hypothetical protein